MTATDEPCTCFDLSHNDVLLMRAIMLGLAKGLGVREPFSASELMDALGFEHDVCESDMQDRVAAIVRSARRG